MWAPARGRPYGSDLLSHCRRESPAKGTNRLRQAVLRVRLHVRRAFEDGEQLFAARQTYQKLFFAFVCKNLARLNIVIRLPLAGLPLHRPVPTLVVVVVLREFMPV